MKDKSKPMNKQGYNHGDAVVALDIGTTKICAIIGRRNRHGKIDVLGVGKVESTGVLRGVVSNIDKTVRAISSAIEIAERNSKKEIKRVHVGIAGQHIRSILHRGVSIDNTLNPKLQRKISIDYSMRFTNYHSDQV